MSDNETQEKHRKQRSGEVVSDKGDKTIVVQVKRRARHPLYKKVISHYKKFYAHDPENVAEIFCRKQLCAQQNKHARCFTGGTP